MSLWAKKKEKNKMKMKKLIKPEAEIIYFTQLNNKQYPYRSCFPTSLAMAMRNNGYKYDSKFVHPDTHEGYELDDYLFYLANSKEFQTIASKMGIPLGTKFLNEWWTVMEKVGNSLLNKQGMSCRFVSLGLDGIRAQIDKGKMVVVGTMLTGSGHIVTVCGYNDITGNLILCDPYGNSNNYADKSVSGKCVELTKEKMSKVLKNAIIF